MIYVEGKILEREGFVGGYAGIEGEEITVGRGRAPGKVLARGYILPCLINAHTHVGDTFIKRRMRDLPRDIVKLVAPPNGLKHRLLAEADRKEVLEGIKESLEIMVRSGVCTFCDFREGGLEGISILKDALCEFSLHPILLSRPSGLSYDEKEVQDLLKNSDGIGISSLSDWAWEDLKRIANDAKRKGKIFSLHASERTRENIDLILDLKPDLLIHMVKATRDDLERVRDEEIPIVLCPRSNDFFGLKSNYELMEKLGIKILLGTDNCMISDPDVLAEVRWILKNTNIFSLEKLLMSITYEGAEFFGMKDYGIEKGVVVVDTKSLKPLFVSRGGSDR